MSTEMSVTCFFKHFTKKNLNMFKKFSKFCFKKFLTVKIRTLKLQLIPMDFYPNWPKMVK